MMASPSPSDASSRFEVVGQLKFFRNISLGKGAFGNVYKGEFGGKQVAVKRIQLDFSKSIIAAELGPLQFGKEAWHENLVRYLHKEDDKDFLYIAIELCVGTLDDLVQKKPNVPSPGSSVEILRQITAGLRYLHYKQIVHRDIKPQNILISHNGVVKLTDFGLCKVKTNDAASAFTFTGNIGTLGWAAPELLEDRVTRFKFAVDIFSLGCVFCYVLTNGGHPFGEPLERAMNITQGKAKKEVLNFIENAKLKVITEQMISYRPEDRPGLDVIQHELGGHFLKVTLTAADFVRMRNDIYSKIFRDDVHDFGDDSDLMEKLCESGATFDVCDKYGKNLLHYACENYNGNDLIHVIRLLIEHGAKVDARDEGDMTPLHYACLNDKGNDLSQVIQVLIEHGAKVDACDHIGRTPLHFACEYYKGNDLNHVIQVLIEHGAKVDACDISGKTPLDYVRENGKQTK